MKFSEFASFLAKLEKTSSRNEIAKILSELFQKSASGEIDKICHLVLGRIAPQYTGIEFNLAERMMLRAISQAYGAKPEDVQKKYKKVGDLGDVAEEAAVCKLKATSSKLSLSDVFEKLYKVATEGGEGSQERKLSGIANILKSLDPLSVKYVSRIPLGKLRLGFSDATILDSLSLMEKGDKSARKQIEAAYNVTADIGKIAVSVKKYGIKGLGKVHAEPGIPIRPALAERLDTAEKIIEKVGPKVAVEPKYDGFRCQVHIFQKSGKKNVVIFSRNLENVTPMFPDISEAAKKLKLRDAIFDSEAIGYNPKTGEFYPFQETVQRKRKHGVSEAAKNIPLKVFVFDCLYLNGKVLMSKPFGERRKVLEKILKDKTDTFILTKQIITDDPKRLKQMFSEYLDDGLEGIMAKKIDLPYQAGGRGYHWVKFKKHSEGALNDTIDCLLMGAFYGRGKRAGFGVGGFLLGVAGKDNKIYTISNLGTGLSDEQFRQMNKSVKELSVSQKPKEYIVDKLVEPDIWVRPKIVLEILADEITASPRHTAGRGKDGKGYSLRFPRLIKIREDKNPGDATTVEEIEKLYKMQRGK